MHVRWCVCFERVRSTPQDRCSVELLNTDDDFKKHGIRMDSPFFVFVGPSGEVVRLLLLTVTRVPMAGTTGLPRRKQGFVFQITDPCSAFNRWHPRYVPHTGRRSRCQD